LQIANLDACRTIGGDCFSAIFGQAHGTLTESAAIAPSMHLFLPYFVTVDTWLIPTESLVYPAKSAKIYKKFA
jgi:hypothetical protein